MSVVSGGVVIFCEGKDNSLDYQLLNRVIETIPGDKCTIVPSGGKFTFSSFAEGYFRRNPVNHYIVFRDRDFDVKPSSKIELLKLDNRLGSHSIFLTHRSCIENYLLDAKLIHDYWVEKYEEKQENPISKWGHNDSPGINDILEWIETSARNLQFYQAVRWGLGDLLRASSSRAQLKTTWTGSSGQLPKSLEFGSCKQQALKIIEGFTEAISHVTIESFEEILESYKESFRQEQFWEQQQYLI